MSKNNEIRELLGMMNDSDVDIVTITPEIASKLLAYNTHNRARQDNRIKEYEKDMRDGKWWLSESCIGFNENGEITNGQTRLEACVNSGASFETIVCSRLEQNIHMDTGNVRKVIDNVILNGVADDYINVNMNSLKVICEVIRIVNGNQRVTPEPVVDFCKSYGKYVDKAYDLGLLALQGTEKGLFRVQIAAAFLVALMNGVDESVLSHIRTLLTSGMTSDPSEAIIINWRTQLIRLSSGAGSKSKVNKKQIYFGTQHMIYCIANNKNAKRIKTDTEYYPVIA